MNSITKHLPLLALVLLVSSTQLRADDFPLKVGDIIKITGSSAIASDNEKILSDAPVRLTNIKGKWIEVDFGGVGEHFTIVYNGTSLSWLNSDYFTRVIKVVPQK